MDERSPFCSACGAAQIRVSPRDEPSDNPAFPASGPDDTSASPAHAGYGSPLVPDVPTTIQWGKYFKSAWPLALIAGIATGVFPPGGFLLFLPIAVILSLRLYRKHHFGQIRLGQGALLGAALSVLSFAAVVAIYVLFYPTISGHFRDALIQGLNDSPVHNSNPEGALALRNLLDSPDGVLTLFSFITFFIFCLNTLFACLAGALAASLGQEKPKR
jgi:hypothetical protein